MLESLTERSEMLSLSSPLRSFALHTPIFATSGTTLRAVFAQMDQDGVDHLIVTSASSTKPFGLVSLRDATRAVTNGDLGLDEPIERVMRDVEPLCVDIEGTLLDALLVMAGAQEYAIWLVDEQGRVLGFLRAADLFHEHKAIEETVAPILAAHTIGELAASALDTRRLSQKAVTMGFGVEYVMHWMTFLNDLVNVRVLEMMRERFNLPKVPWCWLVFGSEGREEQTAVTDQDNGLMFSVPEGSDPETLRAQFLPYAQAVNQALDDCGVPYCKGQIMAGNPAWCLTDREWRARFRDWIGCGNPEALLNASIFFDFRGLYGERSMAKDLRDWLLNESASSSIFLRLMAQNALQCQPPVGLLRSFVLDRDKSHPGTLDLKSAGARPFVDGARLLALAFNVSETGTAERLRAVARHPAFSKEDLSAVIDGFLFIQGLRLRSQMKAGANEESVNRVNPYQLNEMERVTLKQAFRQVQRLQARLKVDHRL